MIFIYYILNIIYYKLITIYYILYTIYYIILDLYYIYLIIYTTSTLPLALYGATAHPALKTNILGRKKGTIFGDAPGSVMSKNHGFSPEQTVLGKSTQLPASLSSGDSAAAHSLANGTDLDSHRFQEMLNKRTRARLAFIHAHNSEAIRRALLRRSCPVRGPFLPGQLVMYWSKRQRPNRADVGRWCGPAKVILQAIVWVSHADRILRCAPERLRPGSLRER